jgi:hypothetical protein
MSEDIKKAFNPFVSSEETFSMKVCYAMDEEAGIFYACTEDQLTEMEKDSLSSIVFTCRFPDWGMCKSIVSSSTVNVGGRVIIDPTQLQVAIVESLVTGWDLKDGEGKDLIFSIDKLMKLRPDIVRCLFELVSKKLVEAGVWDSIVSI